MSKKEMMTLRIDSELKKNLQDRARKKFRSLTAEVEAILTKAILETENGNT